MSIKGKRRRVDAVCLTCVHGGVCRRAGEGRCRDYIDRERYREIPPCGKTRIWRIVDEDFDVVGAPSYEPCVMEDVVNVTMWGYDANENLHAVIDNENLHAVIDGDILQVGTQHLYLDRESAEVALRTGAWKMW